MLAGILLLLQTTLTIKNYWATLLKQMQAVLQLDLLLLSLLELRVD